MDGIEYVHMNNTYVGQDRDGSFVYPDDSYFGGIASLVESVQVRFRSGSSSGIYSLICVDDDPHFSECRPSVSHIRWSRRAVANRIVSWVSNISQGKEDTRQTTIKAEFVEGGTVGPAPKF